MIGDPFLNYFALFLLVFVVVVLFYGIIAIHDIPARIAESRHHPHQDAIHAAGWVSLSRISAPNSRTASSRLPCSPLAALPVAPSRLLPRFQPRSSVHSHKPIGVPKRTGSFVRINPWTTMGFMYRVSR